MFINAPSFLWSTLRVWSQWETHKPRGWIRGKAGISCRRTSVLKKKPIMPWNPRFYNANNNFRVAVHDCADIFHPPRPFCHSQQNERQSQTVQFEDVSLCTDRPQCPSSAFIRILKDGEQTLPWCHEWWDDEVGCCRTDVTLFVDPFFLQPSQDFLRENVLESIIWTNLLESFRSKCNLTMGSSISISDDLVGENIWKISVDF